MVLIDKILTKIDAHRKQANYTSYSFPSDIGKIDKNSLLFYFGNIHSQRGQDGILAEIFRRLKIETGSFVEFGAWDGKYLCNSRWLYEKGWSGTFIEGEKERYEALVANYDNEPKIKAVNAFVGAPSFGVNGTRLRDILESVSVNPNDVDFLSVDVDGSDLELFLDSGIQPKVVLLEGGFNFSPFMDVSSPSAVWAAGLQHPLGYIRSKTEEFGYTLVCFYQDSYLVRSDLAGPFEHCIKEVSEFYADAVHFMPQDFRASLIELRKGSKHIRDLEKSYFGCFCEDPISATYAAFKRK